MSKYKFILNKAGVKSILKGPQMKEIVEKKAIEIKNRCGSDYDQNSHVGKNRVNAMVFASTFKGIRDNKKNNTLLKALK